MVSPELNSTHKTRLLGAQHVGEKDSGVRSRLERIKRWIKVWWNKTTLENCLEEKLIPRGLRVQVFPSYGKDDVNFTKEWEETCNQCSNQFLQLIIQKNGSTLKEIDVEIDKSQELLKSITTQVEMDIFNEEMEECFLVWEKQIKNTKVSKYHRDQHDYLNNRIYKWKYTTSKETRKSSMSSVTSTENESNEPSTSYDRHQNKMGFRKYNFRKNTYRDKYSEENSNTASTSKGSFFLQLQGTAMGASCAPSYANLFLGLWERDLFLSDSIPLRDTHFYSEIPQKNAKNQDVCTYPKTFIGALNTNESNIKLTYKAGRQNMELLDVLFNVDDEGWILTDVHRKPTSVNTLLHAESSHPKNLINSIPTGQFLRMRRICSDENKFETQASDLRKRFLNRGYSDKVIQRGYRRAKFTKRSDLFYQHKIPKENDIVRFISTFNARSGKMWAAMNKYWNLLKLDVSLSGHIASHPTITYRRSQNIKDILVRSNFEPRTKNIFESKGPPWGCKPCGSCIACPNIETTKTFSNSSNSKNYKITHSISCKTFGVIYSARCPCNKLYIGLTSHELRRRVREHVLDIKAAAESTNIEELKTIPRHYKLYHNSDPSSFKLTMIISKETRATIIALHKNGLTRKSIAATKIAPQSTIYRIIKNFKERASIVVKKAPGRLRKASKRQDRILKLFQLRDRTTSSAELAQEWQQAGVSASERTVRRRLFEQGLVSRRAAKKPLLSRKNIRDRLIFCKRYREWTAEDWGKVIFSDECPFRLFGTSGK
ncbi:unnamed protein product [Ranitomeya imitator]|uniref:GIY-YIG domain-containing protein n=1 Tax=Ranitomeya imitator TaxID=111125 RepID=A0ABN9LSH6_9NEOB|nr:unnamed protein product [Ranitomeya imitator]